MFCSLLDSGFLPPPLFLSLFERLGFCSIFESIFGGPVVAFVSRVGIDKCRIACFLFNDGPAGVGKTAGGA